MALARPSDPMLGEVAKREIKDRRENRVVYCQWQQAGRHGRYQLDWQSEKIAWDDVNTVAY